MKIKPFIWKVLLAIAAIAGAVIAAWISAISMPKHAAKVQSKYDGIINSIMLHNDLNTKDAMLARDRATKEVYNETKQAVIDRFMGNFGSPPDLGSNNDNSSSTT